MPNRILREGILTSPRIARLGWPEEVFYRRLMSVVDDFGRYYADHGMLRAACYPRQLNKVSDSDIGKWLACVQKAALVRVYPAQDGERYLELLDFGQQVRAKKSKFPDPPSTCVAGATHPPADAPVFGDVFGDEDEGVDEGDARVAARPAKRCPPSFEPDDELRQWAMRDFPSVDFRAELAKFRDHEFAKARSDWPAAFRNWIRKADELRPRKAGRETTADHNRKAGEEFIRMAQAEAQNDGRTIDA